MLILGVRVDEVTRDEALKKAAVFLSDGKQHALFSPNPEMVVKAQTDGYFRNTINGSDLNVCDGFGLWVASVLRKSKGASVDRITGMDFALDLCGLASEQGMTIYLIGSGSNEIVTAAANNLQKQFPALKIAGHDKGPRIEEVAPGEAGIQEKSGLMIENEANCRAIDAINNARPDVLLVAFGMGKQEKWIQEYLAKMPSVKIAMGVGGSFDYLSGRVPRAPRLMRRFGLEWLYRLWKEPRRFGRIFNATVKFVYYYAREFRKH